MRFPFLTLVTNSEHVSNQFLGGGDKAVWRDLRPRVRAPQRGPPSNGPASPFELIEGELVHLTTDHLCRSSDPGAGHQRLRPVAGDAHHRTDGKCPSVSEAR